MFLSYSFRLAMQSIWREKWINLLSVLTIAAGLLIITLALFSIYNINLATKKLPEKFSIMLYLKDGLSDQDIGYITAALEKDNAVEKVKYIPKDEAIKELRGVIKDADYILEGLNENPLPASIELKLKQKYFAPSTVKRLASDIKRIKGVDEVEFGEQFLTSIHSIKTGVQTFGLLLIAILSAGIIFVCYSTVKILFYRKKEEIETLKLLGATRGFIRAPFVIEGGLLGGAGGFFGMVGALAFYYGLFNRLTLTMPLFKGVVFPFEMFIFLPLVGLFLGITGAIIAIGRIRF